MPGTDVGAVRFGIVGCGLVVERGYLPAFAGLARISLAAVAEPREDRRRLAAEAGVTGYLDLEAMLAGESLDGVLICSPPPLHLEHAETCARAGVRALVEKPPGVSFEDSRLLAALRPEPALGFNRRFARGLPTGRRAVAEPSRVTAIFDAPPGDWDRGAAPADPLLDLGCHLVDLGCWATGGRPARARAVATAPDRAGFEVEMSDGLRLLGECGAAPAYRELLEVRARSGSTRTWRWPVTRREVVADRLARRGPALIGSWRAQVAAFARLVRGGDPGPLALAREGVQVMAALAAVEASAAGDRGWVTVPRDPRPSGAPGG